MASVSKTAGSEFAARSRITITTQRLPYWFPANDGRDGILLVGWLHGATEIAACALRKASHIARRPPTPVNPCVSCRHSPPRRVIHPMHGMRRSAPHPGATRRPSPPLARARGGRDKRELSRCILVFFRVPQSRVPERSPLSARSPHQRKRHAVSDAEAPALSNPRCRSSCLDGQIMARTTNGVTKKSCRCQLPPPLHNSIEIVNPNRLTELCAVVSQFHCATQQ